MTRGRAAVLTAGLLAASTVLALGGAELALRLLERDRYFVWPPKLEKIFKPAPGLMPGVEGDARISINAMGLRGSMPPDEEHYRVLALGGSTTECLFLDQEETWTALLESELNARPAGPRVWVGNAGKSGHSARDHVLQAEKLLAQYQGIELVLLLVGVNDMGLRLKRDADYRPMPQEPPGYRDELLRHAFSVFPGTEAPDASYPFYKRTQLWRLARRVKSQILDETPPTLVQEDAGDFYRTNRERRRNAVDVRGEPPDLEVALADYRRNLESIIDSVHAAGARIVLMTQPSIWRSDLPAEARQLLWLGRVGEPSDAGNEYYAIEALAEAMRRFNETLLALCGERDVECLDLASMLPRDTTIFYDDVHFTEEGARQVARILADYLARRPPLGP